VLDGAPIEQAEPVDPAPSRTGRVIDNVGEREVESEHPIDPYISKRKKSNT